jgi:hypothetical protein
MEPVRCSTLEENPGPKVIKLFTAVICEFLYYTSVFTPGKPFQLSLMFASKAGNKSIILDLPQTLN